MMKRWTIRLLAFLCAFSLLLSPITAIAAEVTETEPVATEPQVTEPVVTEPEATEPEATEPEVTEPEATEPEVTEPEVTEPEATEPEATEPEVTEPEATEPEATEPEVVVPTLPEKEDIEKSEGDETASQNGFVENDDGTWSYYQDGTLVTSAVIAHNGAYYGFNGNGIMFDNTSFRLYSSEDGRYVAYRAKEGGALYVNEWYYPYPDSTDEYYVYYRYYYGEGGKAPYGVATVDGVLYAFDSYGQMRRNTTVNDNGVYYAAGDDGRLQQLNSNGWTQVGEEWYYMVDGSLANGVLEIKNVLYMFSSGRMLKDTTNDYYDETEGRWIYYRAKADGTLYVNEWYYPDEDDTSYGYYYGEGGKAPRGYTEVDGVYYYFSDYGEKLRNYSTTVDGVIYVTDSNGYAYILGDDGWTQVGEEWYYVVDGAAANGVLEINHVFYMFSNGRMLKDTTNDYWDATEGRWVYYRAKADGTLYVNEWYYPYENNTTTAYYYGEGGKAPTGYTEVDGVYYYFSYNGQKRTNYSTTVDGVIYVTDSNGLAYILNSSGWTQVGEEWYYVVDGVAAEGVLEISHVLYMFSNGKMLRNTSRSYWDEDLQRSVYYRAKADGTLYVNEWYYPNEGNTSYAFYYGEGGKAPKGYTEVDGAYYYFDYDGEKLRGYSTTVDGVTYVTDSFGYAYILNSNGWTQVGDEWYYAVDGVAANGVLEINHVLYMFSNGKMLTNTSTDFWDETEGRWIYYRAKADGTLYINEWFKSGSTYYYYGEGGKSAYGYTNVNGNYYYFNYNGRMYRNSTLSSEGECYICDNNGYCTKLNSNGWTQVGDEWYYAVNGELAYGVLQISGKYYMFSGGKMLTNTTTDFYDSEEERWVYYRAKADGTLYVNEWYKSGSNYYYYGEGGRAPEGYTQVGGSYYFFNYNGRMLTNTVVQGENGAYQVDKNGYATVFPSNTWVQFNNYWYYAKDGILCDGPVEINGVTYLFYGGRMLTDGSTYHTYDYELGREVSYRAKKDGTLYINEWYYPNSNNTKNAYYYGEGGKSAFGVMEIDGQLYSFDTYGKKQLNAAIEYNGAYYVLDANGNMTPMQNNAWTEVAGEWYYIQNGKLCKNGVYQIGSNYYMFDDAGCMMTDTRAEFYDEDKGSYYYYQAKADGTLCVNAWYQVDGYWYYYGEGGRNVKYFNTINGKNYYFTYNGRMRANETVQYDGIWYIADANGILQVAQENGWKQVSGEWYYFADGEPVYGIQEIDGKLYLMDNGKMTRNYLAGFWSEEEDRSYYYCSGPDGVLYQNTWVQPFLNSNDQGWYYFGEGGKAVSGVYTVNGVAYLFEHDGRMMKDFYQKVGDTWYVSDKNGYAKALANNAWTSFAGKWFYVQDGELCRDGIYEIGGSCYFFLWNGAMLVAEDGYADLRTKAGGQLYRNEWYWNESRSAWMYYDENCRVVTYALVEINGNTYWFNGNGYMATNDIRSCDGMAYSFDAGGKGTKLSDGWYKHPTEGKWMYVREGALVEGLLTIGGKTYAFRYDFFMMTDTVYDTYVDGEFVYYLIGSDGTVVTKPGWYTVDGSYVYVANTQGELHEGWLQLGSSWYYLTPYMRHSELTEIDGALYIIAGNGVCTRVGGNGFYEVDYYGYGILDTCYIENGNMVKDAWRKVNGSWYYMDAEGFRIEGTSVRIDDKLYLFDQNGKMASAGWHLIYGTYYYADASGIACTGPNTIGGVKYLFNDYGEMLKNSYYAADDGTFYFSDRNGVVAASGTKNGWYSADGKWFYVKSGEVLSGEGIDIGGTYYSFDYDGVMVTNRMYDGYMFNASGAAVTGWYQLDGNWYYANPSDRLLFGWGEYTIGSSKYVFRDYVLRIGTFYYEGMRYTTNSSGVVTSKVPLSEGYNYLDGDVYLVQNGELYNGWLNDNFFSDGYMYRDGIYYMNGGEYFFDMYGECLKGQWHEWYDGAWILARENGRLYCNEWYINGSNSYYFNDFVMVRDCIFAIDGVRYEFDENGICQGVVEDETSYADGWKQIGNNWYYYHAGEYVTGMHYISGNWYAFQYTGEMVTDSYWQDYYYGGRSYYFTAGGAMAKYTGWQKIDGLWMYFNDDYSVRTGWFEVGGKKYYVANTWYYRDNVEYYEPYLYTNTYGIIGSQIYKFDANGACEGTVGVENGWYKISGDANWFYFVKGLLINNGIHEIDGVKYCFHSGRMMTNTVEWDEQARAYYYFDSTGKQVTKQGWYKLWGEWIYIGENGQVYDGVRQIDGKIYYFDYIYLYE